MLVHVRGKTPPEALEGKPALSPELARALEEAPARPGKMLLQTLRQDGLLAPAVLSHWGITSTTSVGRVVFALVEAWLLVAQPGDSVDDFTDVYDFTQAFRSGYVWNGSGAKQIET